MPARSEHNSRRIQYPLRGTQPHPAIQPPPSRSLSLLSPCTSPLLATTEVGARYLADPVEKLDVVDRHALGVGSLDAVDICLAVG